MFINAALAGLVAACPLLASARALTTRNDCLTTFNPPTLKPLLHLELGANLPVNASTLYGLTAQSANLGGRFSLEVENSCTDARAD